MGVRILFHDMAKTDKAPDMTDPGSSYFRGLLLYIVNIRER